MGFGSLTALPAAGWMKIFTACMLVDIKTDYNAGRSVLPGPSQRLPLPPTLKRRIPSSTRTRPYADSMPVFLCVAAISPAACPATCSPSPPCSTPR
jgi:hypothetical protein